MVLHVKPDGAELIPRRVVGEFLTSDRYPVPADIVEKLRSQMAPVTEFGNPPGAGWKFGWREMDLPSPAPGEYWLFVQ
jgi:hypothetical protein